MHLLYERNILLDLRKIIQNIYKANQVIVRTGGEFAESIDCLNDKGQGSSMSHLIFNFILDQRIKKTRE